MDIKKISWWKVCGEREREIFKDMLVYLVCVLIFIFKGDMCIFFRIVM